MRPSGRPDTLTLRLYHDGWIDYNTATFLRPIIIFKSGIEGTGTGEDSSPYVLE